MPQWEHLDENTPIVATVFSDTGPGSHYITYPSPDRVSLTLPTKKTWQTRRFPFSLFAQNVGHQFREISLNIGRDRRVIIYYTVMKKEKLSSTNKNITLRQYIGDHQSVNQACKLIMLELHRTYSCNGGFLIRKILRDRPLEGLSNVPSNGMVRWLRLSDRSEPSGPAEQLP